MTAEAVQQPQRPDAEGDPAHAPRKRLLVHGLMLVLSQFLTMPLSVLLNAVLARSLGADEFGVIYLASTMVSFGFLLVDWGQGATVPARVAQKREQAGETLATSVAMKLAATAVVGVGLMLVALALGYSGLVYVALALTIAQQALVSLSLSFTSVLRAFERFDWVSASNVANNVLTAALVIPVALLGGRLAGTLTAQVVAAMLALLVSVWLTMKLGFGRSGATRPMARELLLAGRGFVLLNLVLSLQPSIDAAILTEFVAPAAVGWFGAARRLVGVLIFPGTTLSYMVYPTLARLWTEDRARYTALAASTLRLIILLGFCASMGTYLYADVAVRVVYGREAFGPTVVDLQVLSPFVLLVYLTMILGLAIATSGKQVPWAGAQSLCIVVSVVLDPLLIPICERRYGNGGLGVCISTVISEVLMLAAAPIILRGQGLVRPMAKALPPSLAGGAAMWGVAWILRGVPAPVSMVASVLGFLCVAYALGGIDREHVALLRGVLRSKSRKPVQA